MSKENLGKRLLEQGVVTMSWSGEATLGLQDGAPLLYLLIKARKDGRLSEWLRIGSRYTRAEAYASDLSIQQLVLEYTDREIAPTLPRSYELLQNRPNPFGAETLIGFSLPEATRVRLSIYDLSGKLIREHWADYSAGYHEWMVEAEALPSEGLYFYRLESPAFAASRKMTLHR